MSVTDQLQAALPEEPMGPAKPAKKPRKSILQFELTAKKVPRKELMHFSRQLAVFIKAGIPILDALEAIQEEMGNKFFKQMLEDISISLRQGRTFADAAAEHDQALPHYYLGMLRSAEMSGNLDVVLQQLAEYIDRDVEARRKVSSALIYPAIIAAMSVVVVVVLVAYVLPKFEDFFNTLNAKLPLATRLLLDFSHFASTRWYLFAGALLLTVSLVVLSLRNQWTRDQRDRLLLRLPVLGDLLRHVIYERFCRILSSMITAGVTLPEAMTVTGEATSNSVYRKGLERVREAMLRGEGLAGPLAASGLFPAAARQMFKVGEDTGTLDIQLATAATFFERELDYKIKRFTGLFEPAVIIAMGLVVGFVAIALVSAMYGIFRQVRV